MTWAAPGWQACAALVERGDPDRFAALMAAAPAARPALAVLYAYNLELARAPWAGKEPMFAEMCLQWWADVVAEPAPRAHEVAGPFHGLIREAGLPLPVIDTLIAARLHDAYGQPFEDAAAFDAYLDDTAGGLMWLAAKATGGTDEAAARALGQAMGLANYLRAVPELEARGRQPLPDGRAAAVRDLAVEGLARLDRARGRVPKAAALAAWAARGLLRQVVAEPGRVAEGALGLSEFARRWGLLRASVTGRV